MKKYKTSVCTIVIFLSIITCNIHLTLEKILSSQSGHETFDDSQNIIGLRPPVAKYYVKSDNYSSDGDNINRKIKYTTSTDSNDDKGDYGDINIFKMMSQDEIKGLLDQIPMGTLKKLRSLTAIDPQLSHRFLWKMMKDKLELESEMKSQFLKPSFVDSLMTALWKEKRKKMMKTKEKVLRSIEKSRSLSAIHAAATASTAPPIVFENFEVFQIPSEVFFKSLQGNHNNMLKQNPKPKTTAPSTIKTTSRTTTTQRPKINGGNTYIRFDHIVPAPPNSPQTFITQTNPATFPMVIKQFQSGPGSGTPTVNLNPHPFPHPSAHARRTLESSSQNPQQQQQQQVNTNSIPIIQQWPTTQQQLPVDAQNENVHSSVGQAKWENWPPSLNQQQQQAQLPNLIQPGIIQHQEQQQHQGQPQQQLTNTNSQIQKIPGVLTFQNSQQQIPGSETHYGNQFQYPYPYQQQPQQQQSQTIPNVHSYYNNNNNMLAFPQYPQGEFQSTSNSIPNPGSSSSSHLYGSQMMGSNFASFPYQSQIYTQTLLQDTNPQWNPYYAQLPSQQNYMSNDNTDYFSQPHPYQQQPSYFPSDPSQYYYQNENANQFQHQHPNFDYYGQNNDPYYTHYEHSQYSHEQNNDKDKQKDKDKHHDHHGFFHESWKSLKNAIFGHHHHDKHEKDKEKGENDYYNSNNNNSSNYAESGSASQSNYDHYSKKASHVWDKAHDFFHHMSKKAHDANHKGITTKIFGMSISILAFVSFGLYIMMLLFQSAVLTLNFPLLSGIIGFISGDGGAGLVQFFLGRSLDDAGRQISEMDDLEYKIQTAFNSVHEIWYMFEK